MELSQPPRLSLPTRLVFRENALTKFVLFEPPSIASASSRTGNREDIHEVCHLRSTDRRRTQARSAATASEILLEVPGGAAPCKSKVHLAAGARRLSQSTLFRRAESSLSSPQPHGSHDRFAALVHQAAGRTVGPDDEDDRRPWTQAELDRLENLVGHVSSATIAKRLRRPESSVVNKLKRLGTSPRVRDGYTMRELELCLGRTTTRLAGGSRTAGCRIACRAHTGTMGMATISIASVNRTSSTPSGTIRGQST